MKFSIIIPVYNVQNYLRSCLDSVFSQRIEDFEVIAVNDGSKDNSLSILRDYEQKHSNLLVVDQVNQGVSAARNHGLSLASGDFILFLDSDDRFCENVLIKLEKFISVRLDAQVIVTNLTNYHEKYIIQEYPYRSAKYLRYVKTNSGRQFTMEMLRKDFNFELFAWNLVYKREFLVSGGFQFIDDLRYEDMIFPWEVLLNDPIVYYFSHPLVLYTKSRKGQITGQISQRDILDRIFIGTYWLKRVDDFDMNEVEKMCMLSKVTNLYITACFMVGGLDVKERVLVYQRLEENQELLKYRTSMLMFGAQKMISFLGYKKIAKLFGKRTIQFFKALK